MDVCHIYVPWLFFLCMEFYKSVYFTKNFLGVGMGFKGLLRVSFVEMFEVSYSKFPYNLSLLNFMYLSFSN